MAITAQERKHYKAIAHHLNPVIIVGDKGVSEALVEELNRALNDHELIKVKIASTDRETRNILTQQLIEATDSELVQSIGKVAIILKKSKQPNPKLSNLLRHVQQK